MTFIITIKYTATNEKSSTQMINRKTVKKIQKIIFSIFFYLFIKCMQSI